MSTLPEGMRICPTRLDASESLMTHTITVPECQKRQRDHYHKCPTCTHFNVRAQTPPVLSAPPPRDVANSPGS